MGPSILTTVVGSYPIPQWLAVHPTREALLDAMMAVIKTQELAGIDVITDGELSRFDVNHPESNGMIDYFTRRMSGVWPTLTREELQAFRHDPSTAYRRAPAGVVREAVGEGTLDLPGDFEWVRRLTRSRLKFTVTSPYMLAKVLLDRYYGSLPDLAADIARVLRAQISEVGADVVQVDEANLTGSPQDGEWAADVINTVLDGIRGERAVHLCFGNYGGQTVQAGFWRDLVPFLNRLHADHLVLEFARRGYGELECLKELDPRIQLGIGVIDVKDNAIESPDEVARRIERAVSVLGADRVRYVHPDCGLWMLRRNVADGKLRSLVAGRDRFLGVVPEIPPPEERKADGGCTGR